MVFLFFPPSFYMFRLGTFFPSLVSGSVPKFMNSPQWSSWCLHANHCGGLIGLPDVFFFLRFPTTSQKYLPPLRWGPWLFLPWMLSFPFPFEAGGFFCPAKDITSTAAPTAWLYSPALNTGCPLNSIFFLLLWKPLMVLSFFPSIIDRMEYPPVACGRYRAVPPKWPIPGFIFFFMREVTPLSEEDAVYILLFFPCVQKSIFFLFSLGLNLFYPLFSCYTFRNFLLPSPDWHRK